MGVKLVRTYGIGGCQHDEDCTSAPKCKVPRDIMANKQHDNHIKSVICRLHFIGSQFLLQRDEFSYLIPVQLAASSYAS